jgi:hypothetical protein
VASEKTIDLAFRLIERLESSLRLVAQRLAKLERRVAWLEKHR